MEWILYVLVAWVAIAASYKIIPHRKLPAEKPSFAVLPKYKTEVRLASELENPAALEKMLDSLGFKKSSEKDGMAWFVRGHILGDISIELVKIKLGIKRLQNGKSEITLEASLMAIMDTGDFWVFLTELSQKLETSPA